MNRAKMVQRIKRASAYPLPQPLEEAFAQVESDLRQRNIPLTDPAELKNKHLKIRS